MLEIWECTNYNILNEKERNIQVSYPHQCDETGHNSMFTQWKGSGWYRMLPPAGTRIPESPIATSQCGTVGSGYIQGTHPSNPGETVTRTVCFSYNSDGNICYGTKEIKIRHCGQYMLYHLVPVPNCYMAYCAT